MESEIAQLRSGITAPFNKSLNEALQFSPQMPFNIESTVTPSQLIAVLKGEQGTPGLPAAISAVKDNNNLIMLAVSTVERGILSATGSGASAVGGTYDMTYTVPAGKKWTLKAISYACAVALGACNLQIQPNGSFVGYGSKVEIIPAGATNAGYFFPQPITLDAGAKITLTVTYVSGGAVAYLSSLIYQEITV